MPWKKARLPQGAKEIARRLARERPAAVLGQLTRQIGDLLVGRVILDGKVERQQGGKVPRRWVVEKGRRKTVAVEGASYLHVCCSRLTGGLRRDQADDGAGHRADGHKTADNYAARGTVSGHDACARGRAGGKAGAIRGV
ncbi:hypothetical protein AB7M17_004033 [Bradyrhizobium sp. USDA 377]